MPSQYYRTGQDRAKGVQDLFSTIALRYDLVNDLQSLGLHRLWKRRLVRLARVSARTDAVDLCCGTGDLSLLMHQKGANLVSLDFSRNMLEKGIQKNALKGASVAADASHMPFRSDTFAAAFIAFGIRNIPDIDRFLKDVHRALKPGGHLVILELVRPRNRFVHAGYSFYLGTILPIIGGIIQKISSP